MYIKAVRGDIDDRSYAGVTNTDGAVFEIAKPFTVRQLACELEGNATRLDENDKCVCCLDGRYQIFDVTGEQSCTALCNPEETLWESLWTETTRIALIIVGAVIICQLVCVIIYCTRCCHRWEQENLQDSRKGTKIKHRDVRCLCCCLLLFALCFACTYGCVTRALCCYLHDFYFTPKYIHRQPLNPRTQLQQLPPTAGKEKEGPGITYNFVGRRGYQCHVGRRAPPGAACQVRRQGGSRQGHRPHVRQG